jgi:hypothetical protein
MVEGRPKKLEADVGDEAEWVHAVFREHWNAVGTEGSSRDSVGGYYRSKRFDLPMSYRQRRHVESFMSGLNGTTGNALKAVSCRTTAYAVRLSLESRTGPHLQESRCGAQEGSWF